MDSELKTPYKISLDFYIRKIITVNAKQLDTNSRIVNITCTDNGKKVMLDSSATSAFVRYKKSDGHSVLNQVDILSDGTVNLELSQQMLAVEGRHLVDIMLINKSELEVYTSSISVEDDDNGSVTVIEKQTANVSDLNVEEILNAISENGIAVLSTMSFYINTEGVAIDGAEIESSYEYNALIEGLGKMVAVDNRMSTLEQTINTNETQRQEKEQARQTTESERVVAETKRENDTQQAIKDCETATSNANKATTNANNATKNAQTATENANTATNNATDATTRMETLMYELNQTIGGVIRDEIVSNSTTYSSEKIEGRDIAENPVTFETFDDKGQETYMETETIASGDNLGKIISKLTKYTNNLRYIYDTLSPQTMIDSGYYYVGNEIVNLHDNLAQISNPNLFINGNFQIWSNGESFEVYGTNNEGTTTAICDKWYAKHYDLENNYYITKAGAQGIRLFSASEEPCYIYQILDEETFNALQGKTVTLSWSYTQSYGDANHVEYGTIEKSEQIIVGTDLDVFTAMTRIGFTSGINGCIVHWIKLEVGELKTPCVPDSKDVIICRLEKQIDELPIGTFTISGVMSKSNWTQRILVYQLPLGIDTSGYNISCSQLTACVNQSQYEAEIYQCVFQHDSIWVSTLDVNVEGCYAFAEITITKK